MYYAPTASSINLQATLATSTAAATDPPPRGPHHPITCQSILTLAEDGTMTCEHARVGPDDPRTRACLDQSIAILLIEVLREKEDHGCS